MYGVRTAPKSENIARQETGGAGDGADALSGQPTETPMQPARTSMTPTEWGMLFVLSLLWGGSFFFNGVAVKDLPPMTIVFVRVALGAAILHVVMAATGRRLPASREVWLAFLGMGMLNNLIPFTLILWGQGQIASGVASIINATTPLFTVLVAHVFTADERLTPMRAAGVIAGFAGVAVMLGVGQMDGGAPVMAYAACLAAALSYALSSVYGRRFRRLGVAPMSVATGQLTISAFVLLPVMLAVDRPWALAAPGMATILALIGLATLSTAVAYLLFFRILSGAGATAISLVTFLIPPSAILLGIAFLGEVLLPRHVAGLALIGLGLALVDGRLMQRRARVVEARSSAPLQATIDIVKPEAVSGPPGRAGCTDPHGRRCDSGCARQRGRARPAGRRAKFAARQARSRFRRAAGPSA